MKKKVINLFTLLIFTGGGAAYATGTLTYQQFSRLNSTTTELADQSWVDLSLNGDRQGKNTYHYDFSARMAPSSDRGGIYSFSEGYYGRRNGRTSYLVGRKILDWNTNEKFWSLGDLNAVRGFNHLEDNQEGIFGLHFSRENKRFKNSCFVSAIHIPQVNPTYSYGDGTITPKNEWTAPPPTTVKFRDQEVPIHYDVEVPRLDKILLQEGIGCQVAGKWKSGSVSTYATWKAENAIRLNATGYYEQFGEDRAYVRTRPFVNHHFMAGLGLKQYFGDVRFAVNLDTVRPERGSDESFVFETLKIKPVYVDQTYVTTSLVLDKKIYHLGAHFYQTLEGDYTNNNAFGVKPKWHRAFGGFARWYPWERLSLMVKMKHDIDYKDTTFKGEGNLSFWRHYSWGIGAEVIDGPKDDSFWSTYRSNDTVYTNFAYKF